MGKEVTARWDGIRRLWDLVMKFGGEFGGYGDTSFRPAPALHPVFALRRTSLEL